MKDSFLISFQLMCLMLFLKDDGGSSTKSMGCAANMQPAVETCGLLWSPHSKSHEIFLCFNVPMKTSATPLFD